MNQQTNPVELPQAMPGTMNRPSSKNGAGGNGALLQAREVTVKNNRGETLLRDVSLHIQPNEFIVVTGSTQAISALMVTLAGEQKAADGEVLVDGVDVFANRKIFRSYIGYVPAEIRLHEQLTVQETLSYAANLQMPRGTPHEVRKQRVKDLITSAGLSESKDRRLSRLTAADRYLTSICVELLNKPTLVLVETPEAGLPVLEEFRLAAFLRDTAHNGPTVVYATDQSRCMMLADKVAIITDTGELGWFGPPNEALAYFQHATGGTAEPYTFDDVSLAMDSAHSGDREKWAKEFQANSAYYKYVDGPLNDERPDLLLQDRPLKRLRGVSAESQPPPKIAGPASTTIFGTLFARSLRVLSRQPAGLWMLAVPVLAALTDFLFSSPDLRSPVSGDVGQLLVALGVIIFLAMLTPAFLLHTEILKEKPVYRREVRTAAISFPYVLSKTILSFLLAGYIALVVTVVHFLASGMSIRPAALPGILLTLALVALTGGMIGLLASSLARFAQTAAVIVLILVIAQMLFSGPFVPLNQNGFARMTGAANPAHYAFESLLVLSDYGREVGTDGCWLFYRDQRNTLSDEQKQFCNCMGESILAKCNFPGIRKYFGFEIEQARPSAPDSSAITGEYPIQPPRQEGQTLEEYEQAINQYTLELEQYNTNIDGFINSLQAHAQALEGWQRTRSLMIGNAEGEIAQFYNRYGQSLQVHPERHWLVMLAINVFLFFLLTFVMKRKGIVR